MKSLKKIKKLVGSLMLCFIYTTASSVTDITVNIKSGGDDLREGNSAFIIFNFSDGTSSPEYKLANGLRSNTGKSCQIILDKNIRNASEFSSMVIRHDGSPRPGNPFDTYDNWDLQSIKVYFSPDERRIIANQSGNPLVRFSGNTRNFTFRPLATPPSTTTRSIKVFLTTGADDLRGGNNAFIRVTYSSGATSTQYGLGGGFASNSNKTITVTLDRDLRSVGDISSVTITHDGTPRNPFDTYDNWNLQSLRVVLVMPNGTEPNIVNLNGNPLTRFTGDLRSRTWTR
jgi:hypothetical protein